MNEFIQLDDGRYYRRSAFTTFLVSEETETMGGEPFSYSEPGFGAVGHTPLEYVATGRWQLRGRVDGEWKTLCTCSTAEEVSDFAFQEFGLEVKAPEPSSGSQ